MLACYFLQMKARLKENPASLDKRGCLTAPSFILEQESETAYMLLTKMRHEDCG